MSRHKSALTSASLVIAIAVIFYASIWMNRDQAADSSFVGSDTAATEYIEENNPEYRPWFAPVFTPTSGEIESGLFALQAALGAGVFGFALGALWQRRRAESGSRSTTPVPAAAAEPED
ncbi:MULTISPECIES: energy-coupling factor ABC transporter substrate-binding protein [Rhodococcus]|uniref:energy-coupling factor ABC transporter substrate-binding protein n=1 Tax=Rhodococcus TaxID=1827 RepID=UPI00094AE501|nr:MULTISPECIES: energy-coupling factor ABC transporter substrate-binding protein [Rhodococcus]MDO2378435.1 energy-coupling factor ABC transporter substrate-binding protein [Rhodococcus ruber]MBC2586963.1 energy-coupling factor ABC transporter substrate-binding protein [Rhodococcus aetherivorans]MDO1482141.1 energy-coupling factor ABC transporter substrate-binding protein [Rhodococcus ruber]OLL16073.1 cobalt ABC transporter substrate-binding protein CbiN [Rhodococcus sp. M8]QPG48456.1 energy-c